MTADLHSQLGLYRFDAELGNFSDEFLTGLVMENQSDIFDEELQAFFDSLNNGQEELGVEFSKVLFDNLWDLYEDA